MYDREYEYVSAIARVGTLSGAAVELGVSQPALTHFLKREEKELGTSIFQRIDNRLVLTYAGECYMENVQKILEIQSRMRATIQDIARVNQGRLRMGVPSIRRAFSIFEVIPEFKKRYPTIDLSLVEQSSSVLEEMLENLELDCIAVNVTRRKDSFGYLPILKERYVLAVHKDSPLLEKAQEVPGYPYPLLQPEALNGQDFLMLGRENRVRQFSESVLEANHVNYTATMHLRTLNGALEAVANGLGCTFTSDIMPQYVRGGENLRFLCVDTPKTEYEFCLIYRKGAYLPPSTLDFMQIFRSAFLRQKGEQ